MIEDSLPEPFEHGGDGFFQVEAGGFDGMTGDAVVVLAAGLVTLCGEVEIGQDRPFGSVGLGHAAGYEDFEGGGQVDNRGAWRLFEEETIAELFM